VVNPLNTYSAFSDESLRKRKSLGLTMVTRINNSTVDLRNHTLPSQTTTQNLYAALVSLNRAY